MTTSSIEVLLMYNALRVMAVGAFRVGAYRRISILVCNMLMSNGRSSIDI